MTRPPHAASSVVGYASDTASAVAKVEPNSNRSRETGRPYCSKTLTFCWCNIMALHGIESIHLIHKQKHCITFHDNVTAIIVSYWFSPYPGTIQTDHLAGHTDRCNRLSLHTLRTTWTKVTVWGYILNTFLWKKLSLHWFKFHLNSLLTKSLHYFCDEWSKAHIKVFG